MTTEEKAKAYDEALERAKAHINSKGIGDTVDLCKHLFSELRESEDETTRKELLDFVKSFCADHGRRFPQVFRWISYLENQKENPWSEEDEAIVKTMCKEGDLKPSERAWLMNLKNRISKDSLHISEMCKENVDSFADISEDEKIRKEISTLYSDIDACITELLKARIDKDSEAEGKALFKMEGLMVGTLQDLSCIEDYLEKQKEQKPHRVAVDTCEAIDKVREFDEQMEKEQKPVVTHGESYHTDTIGTQQVIAGKMPQKPAEWSENESNLLDSIIEDYEKANRSFCGYDGKIGLLKAIRSGEYNLPKQEWSEEDEKMLELVIANYEYMFDKLRKGDDSDGIPDHILIMDWLKSLRPQSKQMISEDTEVLMAKLVNLLKSYGIGEETTTTLANRISDTYGTQRYMDGLCDGGKPYWKPSKEQMKWLKDVIKTVPMTCRQQVPLESLYNDLLKQM